MPKKKLGHVKLGYHAGTGQYRKHINGRMYYFGGDEKRAIQRYLFLLETGLVFKKGYRQYCLVENGHTTPVGRTMDEARTNLPAIRNNLSKPVPVQDAALIVRTVRDVGDAYAEWLHTHDKSPQSIRDTVRVFRSLIAFRGCGNLPLEKVDKAYFKRWRDYCHAKVRSGVCQPTWANKRMRVTKAAFNRCDKEGWINLPLLDNIIRPLEVISGRPHEKETFEPSELRKLLDAANLGLKTAILLAINTGIGNSDIGRLKWRHLTQKKIRKQIEHRLIMPRGKTSGRRRTSLWAETVQLLADWKAHQQSNQQSVDKEAFVWTTRYGTPLVYSQSHDDGSVTIRDNLKSHFSKLLQSVGMARPNLGFYSIRHSGATWAADYGEEDTTVAEGIEFYLGDAPDKIWKNYSHGVPPSLRRVVRSIHEALFDEYDSDENDSDVVSH